MRKPLVLGAFAAVVVLALALAHLGDTASGRLDGWVPLAEGGWRTVALAVDFLGEPLGAAGVVAVLVIACLATGQRRLAVLAVAGPAATVGVTTVLKPLVGRTIHGPDNLSFPSGHTAAAAAFAVVIALLCTRGSWRTAVAAAAALGGVAMAWSQVSLGAHYETDTLGGFCTALAVMPVAAAALDRFGTRRTARRT